jgi:ABC-2 type transport system permease protein
MRSFCIITNKEGRVEMNRILFYMEFRRNARSLVIWSLVIGLLIFFTMSFFRTVLQYQQQITGVIQLIPLAAMKVRGFSNIRDIFSVMGFYAANNIVYMMLLGSIFAIVLSSNILLKEEYNKTAEFLMSKPITRNEIFFSKLTLAFLNILILNLFTAIVSLVAIETFRKSDFNITPFLVLALYTLFLNLLFGSLGFFIAVVTKRAKPVTFFCVGIVLIFYFLYSISRIPGINGDFGFLSPFKWVNIEVLSPVYGLEFIRVAGFIGIAFFLVVVSGFIYRKKDILT